MSRDVWVTIGAVSALVGALWLAVEMWLTVRTSRGHAASRRIYAALALLCLGVLVISGVAIETTL